MAKLELSLLDTTIIWNEASASQVFNEALDMAMFAEQLGYKRYWLTENHNSIHHASSVPEILMAQLVAHTSQMKVGTSNLMLPHQSALKVVENFRTLEGVYPGRIDLGIDLSIGEDFLVAQALHRTHDVISEDEYPEQLKDLLAYFTDQFSTSRGQIIASPKVTTIPDIWIQGSNQRGAQYATEHGLGFVFEYEASSPNTSIAVLQAYRKYFTPSVFRSEPHSILIVPVLCMNTDEASRIGSELRQLAEESSVDEVMIITLHPDMEVRMRSVELLAKQFRLASYTTSEGGGNNNV